MPVPIPVRLAFPVRRHPQRCPQLRGDQMGAARAGLRDRGLLQRCRLQNGGPGAALIPSQRTARLGQCRLGKQIHPCMRPHVLSWRSYSSLADLHQQRYSYFVFADAANPPRMCCTSALGALPSCKFIGQRSANREVRPAVLTTGPSPHIFRRSPPRHLQPSLVITVGLTSRFSGRYPIKVEANPLWNGRQVGAHRLAGDPASVDYPASATAAAA